MGSEIPENANSFSLSHSLSFSLSPVIHCSHCNHEEMSEENLLEWDFCGWILQMVRILVCAMIHDPVHL